MSPLSCLIFVICALSKIYVYSNKAKPNMSGGGVQPPDHSLVTSELDLAKQPRCLNSLEQPRFKGSIAHQRKSHSLHSNHVMSWNNGFLFRNLPKHPPQNSSIVLKTDRIEGQESLSGRCFHSKGFSHLLWVLSVAPNPATMSTAHRSLDTRPWSQQLHCPVV